MTSWRDVSDDSDDECRKPAVDLTAGRVVSDDSDDECRNTATDLTAAGVSCHPPCPETYAGMQVVIAIAAKRDEACCQPAHPGQQQAPESSDTELLASSCMNIRFLLISMASGRQLAVQWCSG